MTLISVTRLRLRSLDHLPDFLEYADRSLSQAEHAPGNIHTTKREQT